MIPSARRYAAAIPQAQCLDRYNILRPDPKEKTLPRALLVEAPGGARVLPCAPLHYGSPGDGTWGALARRRRDAPEASIVMCFYGVATTAAAARQDVADISANGRAGRRAPALLHARRVL